MDKILIRGGKPLHGTLQISGAKNAALPLMAASLLTEETLTLSNLPHLADITTMANLIMHMGVTLGIDGSASPQGYAGRVMQLNASHITSTMAPYDIVRKMRASAVVLGPLLARFGKAKVSLPGGCAIGTRPIDLHLRALESLGAMIELEEGYVVAHTPRGLQGAEIVFPFISVGATENILMAASLAQGTTVIHNAACEPEVTDLANCLNAMGAKISGVGAHTLEIEGVSRLHGATHSIVSDRIEAGTFAIAALMTNGELTLENIKPEIMQSTLNALESAGAIVHSDEKSLTIKRANKDILPVSITTEPFPGFATDMQAQMMALVTLANGESDITETIFENRFMHVPELMRMNADITVSGNKAVINGVKQLKGAEVMATDLRASVAMILAGLAAEGVTTLNRIYHLDRGYEHIEEKLRSVGAQIARTHVNNDYYFDE